MCVCVRVCVCVCVCVSECVCVCRLTAISIVEGGHFLAETLVSLIVCRQAAE